MDTTKAKREVQNARDVLETKGAPIEGTAAGHLILALEALLTDLDNSFGYARAGGKTNMVAQQAIAKCLHCETF